MHAKGLGCLNWSSNRAILKSAFAALHPTCLIATFCIAFFHMSTALGQTWFAPDYRTRSADNAVHTPADFMHIFDDTSWAGHPPPFQVFKIYAMFIRRESDSTLSEMIAWLRRSHLQLAVEFGMLTPEDCGSGVEGYDGIKSAAFISRRISRLGGRIDFLAMDEPYWHSSHSPKPNACHWPVARTAGNAAATAQVFRTTFPAVEIGDIEPVEDVPTPGLGTEFGAWADAFKQATGHSLAFFHMDVLWDRPWQSGVRETNFAMNKRSIPVGVILSGDVKEGSGAGWMESFRSRQQALRSQPGEYPPATIIQSWSTYPDHIFPASDPTAFASLLYEVH